jgi:hypothetical protein
MPLIAKASHHFHGLDPRRSPLERHPKSPQPIKRQNTQSSRERLLCPHRTGDRASSEDNRGQEREFDTVLGARADAQATEYILEER